jgi:hypothetical protein
MLGVIAAVALVVGGIQTVMIVSDNNAAEQSKAPVVEVQAVQSADASKTDFLK